MKNKKINIRKKQAVAISYNENEIAPKVVAKGKGYMAQQIIKQAEIHQVSINENAALVKELGDIELGLHIPPELYEVVAEVLLFVESVNEKMKPYYKQ